MKKHVFAAIAAIAPHDSQERFEGLGVKVIRESATFIARNRIRAGKTEIEARNFVIATGAAPAIPDLKGLPADRILTNETIFALAEVPAHLVIIGGGAVGVEMAQAHRRLGSKVTILETSILLSRDEPENVAILRDALRDEGIKIYENILIEQAEPRGDSIVFSILQGEDRFRIDASHVLVAAGRRARTEGLGLEQAGVACGPAGIVIDNRLRTTNKAIYAAGDVTPAPHFTHVAGYHAGIIIRNLVFKIPAKTDYSALPWVTCTDPELAQVGMTEQAARAKYGDRIRIIKCRLKENDRARTENRTGGQIKLVVRRNGRVLGASIVAPHAGELIGLWALAIREKIRLGKIAAMILPYPTYSELSKSAASAFFASALFSAKTRLLAGLLRHLPF